jgi:hypothetical protein
VLEELQAIEQPDEPPQTGEEQERQSPEAHFKTEMRR